MKLLKFLPLFVLALVFAGCDKSIAPPPAPASVDNLLPKHAQPKLPTMRIFLGVTHDNNLFRPIEALDAELALTAEQEMTGMMYRTNIQETDAMLFVLPYTQRANFWMKNCPESISAAYITPNGVIAEIHHLEQNDTNGVLSATDNIRFVLETKEGWFQRHNISPGAVIVTEKGSLPETFLQNR